MTLVILPNRKLQAWLMRPWTVYEIEKALGLHHSSWMIADIANLLDRRVEEIKVVLP